MFFSLVDATTQTDVDKCDAAVQWSVDVCDSVNTGHIYAAVPAEEGERGELVMVVSPWVCSFQIMNLVREVNHNIYSLIQNTIQVHLSLLKAPMNLKLQMTAIKTGCLLFLRKS